MTKLSDDPDADPKVGYGRPPRHAQFKPGQSGNPRGRPRGSKNKITERDLGHFADLFSKEADRVVPINEPDVAKRMSMARAIFRSIGINAARGKIGAQRLFADLCMTMDKMKAERFQDRLRAVFEYKEAWQAELHRRTLLGLAGPEPDPQPDHIQVDLNTGTIQIIEPFSETDQRFWTDAFNGIESWKQELKTLEKEAADPNCEYHEQAKQDLARAKIMVARLAQLFPDQFK